MNETTTADYIRNCFWWILDCVGKAGTRPSMNLMEIATDLATVVTSPSANKDLVEMNHRLAAISKRVCDGGCGAPLIPEAAPLKPKRPGNRKGGGVPRKGMATVSKSSYLSVSGDVIEAIGSPEYVVLACVVEDGRPVAVRIQPAAQGSLPDNAFRLRKNSAGWIVLARPFCRHYNIPSPLYDLPVTIEDGMAVFEIPTGNEGEPK